MAFRLQRSACLHPRSRMDGSNTYASGEAAVSVDLIWMSCSAMRLKTQLFLVCIIDQSIQSFT